MTSRRPSPSHGAAALVVCAITWGATFPVVRLALRDASPLVLNALRFSIATAVLLPWLAPRLPRMSRGTVRRGLLIGLVLAAGFAAQSAGMLTITAGRSAFLTSSYVLLTPLVAFALHGRRPGAAAAAGAVVAMAGIALMTGPTSSGPGPGTGDVLTLAGAGLFALQIVLLDAALRAGDRVRDLLFLQLAACAALSALASPLVEAPRLVPSARLAGTVLFLAVVASAGALALQAYGQRGVDPSRAALIVATEPVWAALLAWPLGEAMTMRESAGAALLLAGVVIGTGRSRRGQSDPPRSAEPS